MNEELKKLYASHWDQYRENILFKVEAAFPFLITASDRYISCSRKVMFVGQETQGWDTEDSTIDGICKMYDGFVNARCYRYVETSDSIYKSPYWNFQRRILKLNPSVGFISNNIVKIGKKHNAGCSDSIDNLAHEYFPVFMEELRILKPDVIVFLTGPYYDWRIRRTMGNFTTQHIGEDGILCDRLIFEDKTIPDAIRINHPGWLIRNNNKIYHDKLYHKMISIVDQFIKDNI